MGYSFSADAFNSLLAELKTRYKLYAPKVYPGKGRTADTDLVAYGEVEEVAEIAFDRKTVFSPKEIIFPVNQTMFYFTREEFKENLPAEEEKESIVFLRACDIHGVERMDVVFLQNGPYRDAYYEKLRGKVRFFLMACDQSWENCFCVSTGSNRTKNYSVYVRKENGQVFCLVQDEEFKEIFSKYGSPAHIEPRFIEENKIRVQLPEEIDQRIFGHRMWEEYAARCSACGRCTVCCPTCTCFTIQDVFYRDNPDCGERRRVWASCLIDGFTDMAAGISFRPGYGERLRFKALHKAADFKKRFGLFMCVGCGRCDDVCPEYISFSKCLNRINEIMGEVGQR